MRFESFSFGSIRIDGLTYGHDVVIDRGHVQRRSKKPSKKFREAFGHTPLSLEEEIPWKCRRLVIGTGGGALPVMDDVKREAKRRHVELLILPTAQAIEVLNGDVKRECRGNQRHTSCDLLNGAPLMAGRSLADRLLSPYRLSPSVFSIAIAPAILLWGVLPPVLGGQSLMDSPSPGAGIGLAFNDSAMPESKAVRKEPACALTPSQPFLTFDLRFHSLFDVEVPMKELSAAGDELAVFVRVTPTSAAGDSVYFSQAFPVPELGKSIGGRVHLDGGFVTGEGRYSVQLMMRHRGGRICTFHWDADAALSHRDPGMKLAIPAGHIEGYDDHVFHAEAPVARMKAGEALRVKVIANFTPQQGSVAGVPALEADLIGVVSILRNISREPRIARFSIVAFDMNEQRVIFRQNDADQIDFTALGRSVAPLKPGVVQYRHPIRSLNVRTASPVFYLNYNLAPVEIPWRDAIGKVVKLLRGAEYTISCPRDIWMSWADVMKRIGEQKHAGMPDSGG